MNANLKYASVASETGLLLAEYLEDRGVELTPKSSNVLCYGLPSNSRFNLNGLVGGGNKIKRLVQMKQGNVRTVPWFQGTDVPEGFQFPALARQISGHGGLDIVPVFQREEVPWRVKAGWSWFSSVVPVLTEYRVWIYRGTCLDVYEKVMNRPEDYKYVGRNFRNGFDFQLVTDYDSTPVMASISEAIKCVRSLSFDFGAVDLLVTPAHVAFVLECNTAPGVVKSGAQVTLGKLADHMVEWLKAGCPERGY